MRRLTALFVTCCVLSAYGEELAPEKVKARLEAQKAILALIDGEDLAGARRALEEARKLDPSWSLPLFNLAVVTERQAQFAEAAKLYDQFIAHDPQSPRVPDALDGALRCKALAAQLGTRKVAKDEVELVDARTLLAQRRYPEAAASATNAIKLNPKRGEAHLLLAAALSGSGLYERALAAIKVGQKSATAKDKAALATAATELQKRIRSQQSADEAQAFAQKGQWTQAASSWRAAWQTDPARDDCALRAARAYLVAGDAAVATGLLNTLAASPNAPTSLEALKVLAEMKERDRERAAAEAGIAQADRDVASLAAATERAAEDALGMWSENLPAGMKTNLEGLIRRGVQVKGIAFDPYRGGYFISYDRNGYVANNVSASLVQSWAAFAAAGEELRDVAFTPNGGWVFIRGWNGYSQESIPQDAINSMTQIINANERNGGIVFWGSGHLAIRAQNGWWVNNMPQDFVTSIQAANKANESISCLTIRPDGKYVFVRNGNGSSWGGGLPESFTSRLQQIAGQQRVITAIGLAPNGGWVIVTRGR